MFLKHLLFVLCCAVFCTSKAYSQSVLVEAESFDDQGGWSLDTQFIREMGSPYLLAHGLGRPVQDATTEVTFPETGTYKLYVRTKDWVARWNAPGTPGMFELLIDGEPVNAAFGTKGANWNWQSGGEVQIKRKTVTLALHDVTGFEGRCDAIYFTKDNVSPPDDDAILAPWRRQHLGLPESPEELKGYDLVVIGGGYSGMGAALSAARAGCKVALIQDRPVLGGNGSSEVRVWSMGLIRRGKYPRIGEIVEEFCDHAKKSPGNFEEFEDARKELIVRAEENIDLYLNHHAYDVDVERIDQAKTSQLNPAERGAKNGRGFLKAVYAFDTHTSARRKFVGSLFADCTGHATIGFLAGADWDMEPEGRMGMSNMWAWDEGGQEAPFPETPWALDLTMKDFPYPRDHHGQWFWESGFNKDALSDAEGIRDWNLRAVYGAFNAMKNKDGASKHKTAFLTWIAFIGGPRESRRLMGDLILTQDDIVTKKDFLDGCVPSTWSIDLHYPKKEFAEKFPDNPFISIAEHDRRIDRDFGYPVPYRCFYSRNIDNLFMAGRCISVTHEALGTTRVMKTCGMMGEVVGKAASVCKLHDCFPRDVYERYWPEMDELLKLPGKAYRKTVYDSFTIPKDALPLAGPLGPPTGLDPARLAGIVVDDRQAEKVGQWTEGAGLKGYVGYGYLYASPNSGATCTFKVPVKEAGTYAVHVAYQPHENRGSKVSVTAQSAAGTVTARVNMSVPPPVDESFVRIGQVQATAGETIVITIDSKDAGGLIHADAVQLIKQ